VLYVISKWLVQTSPRLTRWNHAFWPSVGDRPRRPGSSSGRAMRENHGYTVFPSTGLAEPSMPYLTATPGNRSPGT